MNIDSSNMTPGHWLTIAHHITTEYAHYDGFVITHGTDTMAYTAAALTYLLRGINKTVVLTGAQYSIGDRKTDAIQNLHDSLLIAAEDLAGIFIVFDGRVINGLLAGESKSSVELIDAEGKASVVLRPDIDELIASKKSSESAIDDAICRY